MARGIFVVVEGMNCAGKTAGADAVANAFRAAGYRDVEILKDPTSSPDGYAKRALEDALLKASHSKTELVTDDVLALLYTLNRMELAKDIESLLEDGFVVVCDRWFYSTLAFQGGSDSIPVTDLACIQLHCGIKHPDLIVYLDVDYPNFMKRRYHREMAGDHRATDDLDQEYFEEIKERYDYQARMIGSGKWMTIDTNNRPETMVYGMVTQAVKDWISNRPLVMNQAA